MITITMQYFGGNGASSGKSGAAGKDGWRDESFEKVDTSSFMLYKNGGAKKITSVHKK